MVPLRPALLLAGALTAAAQPGCRCSDSCTLYTNDGTVRGSRTLT